MRHIPSLFILETVERGRGVFTGEDIEKGCVIEVCPLLFMPKEEIKHIDQTKIYDYYFIFPDESERICIALGYGSLYNHSSKANAEIIFDLNTEEISIQACSFIEAGAEILIDYTGGEQDQKLWFEEK